MELKIWLSIHRSIQPYKHNSPKLRPFRTIVAGYTGQQQNPAVREDWKYIPSDYAKVNVALFQRVEKLKTFMA